MAGANTSAHRMELELRPGKLQDSSEEYETVAPPLPMFKKMVSYVTYRESFSWLDTDNEPSVWSPQRLIGRSPGKQTQDVIKDHSSFNLEHTVQCLNWSNTSIFAFQFACYASIGSQNKNTPVQQTGIGRRNQGKKRTLKVRDVSRNRIFSVGMNPSKKILMPSRTPEGMVTTP